MENNNGSDYIFKAYVVNTAAYDAGERETSGAWLYFPPCAEDIIDLFEKIGLPTDATPDMYFMDDYVCNVEGLKPLLPMHAHIDDLAGVAQNLHGLSPEDRELLSVIQSSPFAFTTLEQFGEFAYNTEYFILEPQTMDDAALGWSYLKQQGLTEIPKGCEGAINPEPFGRYVREQEKGVFTGKGYLVPSGDEWRHDPLKGKAEREERKPSVMEKLQENRQKCADAKEPGAHQHRQETNR